MTDRDPLSTQQKAEEIGFARHVTSQAQIERLIAARVERESRPRSDVWRTLGDDLNDAQRRLAMEERE